MYIDYYNYSEYRHSHVLCFVCYTVLQFLKLSVSIATFSSVVVYPFAHCGDCTAVSTPFIPLKDLSAEQLVTG